MKNKKAALMLSVMLLLAAAFVALSADIFAEPAPAAVIYLNGNSGNDENDGLTKSTAVKTFERAKEIATEDLNIGTIKVTGTVSLFGDITLKGTKAIVQRDENFPGYLFKVSSGNSVTLSNITIDGNSEGTSKQETIVQSSLISVQGKNSTLNIKNKTLLTNNKLTATKFEIPANGGAVYAGTGTTINMTGGTISNNSATFGGGVYLNTAEFNMSGGTIDNNYAKTGIYKKGIWIHYVM